VFAPDVSVLLRVSQRQGEYGHRGHDHPGAERLLKVQSKELRGMVEVTVAPYGAWKSSITAGLIAAGSIQLGQIRLDGDDVYWSEQRPTEGGRTVLVRRDPSGQAANVTPPGFSVRTRVHEYGGAAYLVHAGKIYFSNFDDQRLYWQLPGEQPEPITPEAAMRYADFVMDARRNRLICVREDHTVEHEVVNTLAAVHLDAGRADQVLVTGNDFYSSPCLSPDGARLAWLTWNHPNMPWDDSELWVVDVQADGSLRNFQKVAGGPQESVFQPQWSPDGRLYFVSDRSGWWNLHRWQGHGSEPLHPIEAEFGLAQWVFGMSTYAFASPEQLVSVYTRQGSWHMAVLDTRSGEFRPLDLPYTGFSDITARQGQVYCLAGSPTEASSVVRITLETSQVAVLRRPFELHVDAGNIAPPQPIEFPTEGGQTAHAFFYRPTNPDFVAPQGEKPPLRVISHGGPTGATESLFSLWIQYWTSRGFAVVDVNYGGSTGYGRAYRERLRGRWGVVDVDDCANAARYLVERGWVDGERLAIAGGSAGGYTTLSALTFRSTFKAGASHFGVSDLEALATETHKFESRYLDRLIGPYPERRDLYFERSPIHFTDRLSCPLILLQGLEDKVVPPDQAETMFAAVRAKGLPTAYLPFEGEQHGFRKAENIKRALEAEFYFYSRIFGFVPADEIEPVQIDNLPAVEQSQGAD
jgi:dipeptidyl aminopeptidase/acylaminoacyl peptidase